MERDVLIATAREAALHAYVPYSGFRVGAAAVVETPAGPRVVTGANVENASYGLTLCAERAALAAAFQLVAAPAGRTSPRPQVTQLAVACIDVERDAPEALRSPCGACRQWLAELAPDAVYYVDGIERDLRLPDLLPLAFQLPRDEVHPER
jgi:cytidine deaminase